MRLEQQIFNRTQGRLRRQRIKPHSFLLELAAQEARQRLALVQRNFARALLIGASPQKPLADKAKVQQWLYTDRAKSALTRTPAFISDDEALPLKENSFDLIINLLTLHHANQVPLVLKNMLGALKPDGLMLTCLFAPDSLSELKAALFEAELEIKQGAARRTLPLADVQTLGNLLLRVGFALPVADLSSLTIRYERFEQLLNDLKASAQTQHFSTPPPFLRRDVLDRTRAIYQKKFSDEDKKLTAQFHFAWLIGWKPHASQPQPLKRGSGRVSLARAVNKNM